MKCDSQQEYVETCEKIRYFTMEGKQCRALRFDKEIQDKSDKPNTQIFVKNIPKNMVNPDLHSIFIKYGKIISLKISLNADHSSKGFGYITFD